MFSQSDRDLLTLFERLALAAGRAILPFFRTAVETREKPDRSPVTAADHAAESVILQGLREGCPGLVVVAEEEMAAGLGPRDPGRTFALVDPLDGTREFLRGGTDFTVNIALIRDGAPCVGVVYAPACARFFGAADGVAEALAMSGDRITARRPLCLSAAGPRLRIVASRSHRTPETEAYLARFPDAETVAVGSSLKFCLLAAGEADLYPRFGPTMEWDTAAGDAILRAAGGVTRTLDGEPLRYGRHAQAPLKPFENPFFVAYRDNAGSKADLASR